MPCLPPAGPGSATVVPWWHGGVIYQVYPRSFSDSDGDGIGDLAGITRRLDHFVALGVDALWISPIFVSPMADFGYDVADYCGIDPVFGTVDDFDALLSAAHRRGLRILLDLVPNHSSDRHPWFVASRRGRDDAMRDWYIWRDPAPGGGPPNNWISDFGGSAWAWDAASGQYYYHAFLPEQPDLNWRNPAVSAAIHDVMRFWFDRGVDGFRIDVLWHLIKHAGFPDNPVNPDWRPGMKAMDRVLQLYSTDQPEVHAVAAGLRAVADEYADACSRDGASPRGDAGPDDGASPGGDRGRLLIGEIYLPIDRLVTYYGKLDGTGAPEVQLPFNFELIETAWDAATLAALITRYEAALPRGGWPNWVLGNHDRPRVATRLGNPQARVAMMLLLTLRGTPTVYQGDELGLTDVAIPADLVQDPRERREPGMGLGRDPVRTPLPWDAGRHAGFSDAAPWLPLGADWPTRNVAAQAADPGSMLLLTRRLLALRRANPALAIGEIADVIATDRVLSYRRVLGGQTMFVALNLGTDPATIALPAAAGGVLISTVTAPARIDRSMLTLAADEGIVLALGDA